MHAIWSLLVVDINVSSDDAVNAKFDCNARKNVKRLSSSIVDFAIVFVKTKEIWEVMILLV